VDQRTGKILGRKEMRTMDISVTLKIGGERSLSVLNCGREGQEEKCLSSTGRAEKETKKRGKGRKRRRNW
jgi:hypothetical protein